MQSVAMGDTSRSAVACQTCKRKKIKCSGSSPCHSCQHHGLECVFESAVKRKNYPEAYVNELLEKVAEQAEQLKQFRSFILKQGSESDSVATLLSSDKRQGQEAETGSSSTAGYPSGPSNLSQVPLGKYVENVVRGPVFMANHGFASQVTQALELRNANTRKKRRRDHLSDKSYSNNIWSSSKFFSDQDLALPSELEAYKLQEAVSRTLGDAYHFIDQREFADYVASFYNSQDDEKESSSLVFIRFLSVIALGSLFIPRPRTKEFPPGIQYLMKAKTLLPDVSSLRHNPIVASEILCLIALYLQCCDQREDAYIYVGLAMRLALSTGMHNFDLDEELPRSSITHRRRLWWSLYVLDRRIAATIGAAYGVPDHVIQIPIPAEYPGFCSPAALKANIFTAQTIGEIMCSLYNPENSSNDTIITEVETILNSLHNTREAIPPEYAIDFQEDIHVSRTGATIYLSIFQTIILAVRPILFHLLKRKIRQLKGDIAPPLKCPQDLMRLTDICCCSAVKILRVLMAMKKQDLLATFLPFDLDAAVSAAIVFLVEGVISTTQGPAAVKIAGAFEVLRSMAETGAEVAKKRLQDVKHLEIAIQNALGSNPSDNTREWVPPSRDAEHTALDPPGLRLHTPNSIVEPDTPLAADGKPELPILPNVNNGDFQSYPLPDFSASVENDIPTVPPTGTDRYFPLSLDPQLLLLDDTDLRGIYYESDLSLTGMESSDWLELEKLAQDFPAPP